MKLRHILNKMLLEAHPMFHKIKDFKTSEGSFSVYDIEKDVHVQRKRPEMFAVLKSKDGYIVRNVLIPNELKRTGIATEFYILMNTESKQKTKKPLRSTQPRKLSNGEIVHELSSDGIALWDSFVAKGLAVKHSEKNYSFK